MSDSVHFKLTVNGDARRFALPRSHLSLLTAVKERVAEFTGATVEGVKLAWRDRDSALPSPPSMPLDAPGELHQAIAHIVYFNGLDEKTRNKPPCVHLEIVRLPTPQREENLAAAAAAAATSQAMLDALNASVGKCQHGSTQEITAMLTGGESKSSCDQSLGRFAYSDSEEEDGWEEAREEVVSEGEEQVKEDDSTSDCSTAYEPSETGVEDDWSAMNSEVDSDLDSEDEVTAATPAAPAAIPAPAAPAAPAVASPVAKCLLCNEQTAQFIQCPTLTAHKFCIPCTQQSILMQELHCPSGDKCEIGAGVWSFMTSEVKQILGGHYEQFKMEMSQMVNFNLLHNGTTYKFMFSASHDNLLKAVDLKVITLIGTIYEKLEYFWKDARDTVHPLKTEKDLEMAMKKAKEQMDECGLDMLIPFCVYLVGVSTPVPTRSQTTAPAPQQTQQTVASSTPAAETEKTAAPAAPAAVPQPPSLPLLSCNTCSNVLRGCHFVQCPSDPVHRFCLPCTKALVQRQIGSQIIGCPSLNNCPVPIGSQPWAFKEDNLRVIFGDDYEQFMSKRVAALMPAEVVPPMAGDTTVEEEKTVDNENDTVSNDTVAPSAPLEEVVEESVEVEKKHSTPQTTPSAETSAAEASPSESQSTPADAESSFRRSMSCFVCDERLSQSYVRCPTQENHRFCFLCSAEIIKKQYTNQIIGCPSGENCPRVEGSTEPCSFTAFDLAAILGGEYEQFKKTRDEFFEAAAAEKANEEREQKIEDAPVSTEKRDENAENVKKMEEEVTNASLPTEDEESDLEDIVSEEEEEVETEDTTFSFEDELKEVFMTMKTDFKAAADAAEAKLHVAAAVAENWLQNEFSEAKIALKEAKNTVENGLQAAAAAARNGLKEMKEFFTDLQSSDSSAEKEENEEVKGCEDCEKLKERVAELEKELVMRKMKDDREVVLDFLKRLDTEKTVSHS